MLLRKEISFYNFFSLKIFSNSIESISNCLQTFLCTNFILKYYFHRLSMVDRFLGIFFLFMFLLALNFSGKCGWKDSIILKSMRSRWFQRKPFSMEDLLAHFTIIMTNPLEFCWLQARLPAVLLIYQQFIEFKYFATFLNTVTYLPNYALIIG